MSPAAKKRRDANAIHVRVYKDTHAKVQAVAVAGDVSWITAAAILVSEALAYRAGLEKSGALNSRTGQTP